MTAVEIFFNDLVNQGFIEYKDDSLVQNIFNAALELEKQQIINAYLQKRRISNISKSMKLCVDAEQYYNETYKKE
jgi:hypothetical protein